MVTVLDAGTKYHSSFSSQVTKTLPGPDYKEQQVPETAQYFQEEVCLNEKAGLKEFPLVVVPSGD